MLEQTVAAYTFSKSFSMSGWRLGFAVSSPEIIDVFGKLTKSALSCVPPFTQMAGVVAMRDEREYRDAKMKEFRQKVELLVEGLNKIDGVSCLMPGGTFYVFRRDAVRNRLCIVPWSAMFLMEAPTTGAWRAGRRSVRQPTRLRELRAAGRPVAEAFAFMADAHPHGSRGDVFEQTPRIRPRRATTVASTWLPKPELSLEHGYPHTRPYRFSPAAEGARRLASLLDGDASRRRSRGRSVFPRDPFGQEAGFVLARGRAEDVSRQRKPTSV